MFSKEMEALIQATLEDGKLEENEKAALVKRAQKEGIDIDELEIYINSLLQKRQRELNKEKDAREEKHEQAKKEAFGRVCPNCGKQVPPLTLKCDCGYEFTKKDSVSSVQNLLDKINIISEKEQDEDKRNEMIRETISIFPVPNTKEDIVEFLSLSVSKAQNKGGYWGSVSGRLMIWIPVITVILLLTLIFQAFKGGFALYEIPEMISFYIYELGDSYFNETLGDFLFLIIIIGVGIFGTYILTRADKQILIWNKNARVWKSKFEQVLMKGRSLRGDAEFQRQLDYYENMLNK
jgi:hypothetical protein